jgi:uncharacterized membrane protein
MIFAELVLGAPQWLAASIGIAAVTLVLLAWSYARATGPTWVRIACWTLKAVGIALLAVCLLEPLYIGARPIPGSNLFLVVADNSRSMQLTDSGEKQTRGAAVQASIAPKSNWLTRLSQDFDVRRYVFDTNLRPSQDFSDLTFNGESSSLSHTLRTVAERYRGQPVAGILVLTDGNATDWPHTAAAGESFPPIYPVAMTCKTPALDVSLSQVTVSQTNFEAAPVTIVANIETQAVVGRQLVVRVLDEEKKEVERQTVTVTKAGERFSQRFLIKPEKPGVSFYHVQITIAGEEDLEPGSTRTVEATLANNHRLATVDRGGGPYRVLYVGGTLNWEFKFLRRAIDKDDEVNLVGLLRIAKKQPKFTFLNRDGERTNPLFRGFGNKPEDGAEQDNEPVLVRLGTENKQELLGGFPKDEADLFRYHAVILDDIEATFFTHDQLSLIQQFVSQRGGGLLMMGGKGSFGDGGFARTAVAEALPVYLDRITPDAENQVYRLKLTREGWLQPWIRLRTNEPDEQQRLAKMPGFRSLNLVEAIKPGASILAEMETPQGKNMPALVVQPFGRGRTAALMVGDLWRWELRRAEGEQSDLAKAWRQMIRWLVADVPKPVEVETRAAKSSGLPGTELVVRARDKKFAPLDNARVAIAVQTPSQREIALTAESSSQNAGEYQSLFIPREPGVYRARISVEDSDGAEMGQREVGWTVEPETEEFSELNGNLPLLTRLAADSGGEVVVLDDLNHFIADLPNRKVPKMETWSYPIWHQWTVLLVAFGCLLGEWGLRRWKGMP